MNSKHDYIKYVPLQNMEEEHENTAFKGDILVKRIKEYLPLYDPKKLRKQPTIEQLDIFF